MLERTNCITPREETAAASIPCSPLLLAHRCLRSCRDHWEEARWARGCLPLRLRLHRGEQFGLAGWEKHHSNQSARPAVPAEPGREVRWALGRLREVQGGKGGPAREPELCGLETAFAGDVSPCLSQSQVGRDILSPGYPLSESPDWVGVLPLSPAHPCMPREGLGGCGQPWAAPSPPPPFPSPGLSSSTLPSTTPTAAGTPSPNMGPFVRNSATERAAWAGSLTGSHSSTAQSKCRWEPMGQCGAIWCCAGPYGGCR